MKKILMYSFLTVSLIACKKESSQDKKEQVYFVRVIEISNTGDTTTSKEVTFRALE